MDLGGKMFRTMIYCGLVGEFGSGHGKSASYVGLEERHAKLAVGCSITFVDFIWSTYESRKRASSDKEWPLTTGSELPF